MRPVAKFSAAICLLACASASRGAEYYVSTTGSDSNNGTINSPFASLARGQQAAAPGDTVWIRGGTYAFSGTTDAIGVLFNKSGTSTQPIKYFAYQNETPTFD